MEARVSELEDELEDEHTSTDMANDKARKGVMQVTDRCCCRLFLFVSSHATLLTVSLTVCYIPFLTVDTF